MFFYSSFPYLWCGPTKFATVVGSDKRHKMINSDDIPYTKSPVHTKEIQLYTNHIHGIRRFDDYTR